jgi:integrase
MSAATQGRDPRKERSEQNLLRLSNTFQAVLGRFIVQELKPGVRSWANVQRVLKLHVEPHWGDTPIRDIRRTDVHSVLDGLVEGGRVGTAREVRKHLHRLFEWAVDREIIPDNPLHGLKRGDLAPTEDAGRALSDGELRAVWAAAGTLDYPFGSFYRLLLLTGQRRSEWATATRSDVDFEKRWLEIPRNRYKGGRDHIVPLADTTMVLVKTLPVWQGQEYFLISTTAGRRPISGFSKAKTTLDELAAKVLQSASPAASWQNFRVHDLRVTCETRLANLGFSREVRDAVLGHAKPGLQKTYNKHDYLNEKRDALKAYEDHILGLVT